MTTQIIEYQDGKLRKIRDLLNSPFDFTNAMASMGDIVHTKVTIFSFYVLSNPEAIQDLLIHEREKIVKSPYDLEILARFLGRGLLTNEGESHKQQRKLVQPAFHHKRIQGYATTMVSQTMAFIQDWYAGLILDIDQALRTLTLNIVAQTLFSANISSEEAQQLAHALDQLQIDSTKLSASIVPLPSWIPVAINRRMKAATAVIDAIVWRVIRERRANNQDHGDLLSMLLLSKDEQGNGMSDQQVRDEVITLMTAGHETTANALSWCIYALTQNPEVQTKLHAEVSQVLGNRVPTIEDLPNLRYTEMVIKETLRMYPPAWALTPRITLEPITVAGVEIPKNVGVMPSPYTTHHNPNIWPNPEHFDPERFTPEAEAQRHKYAYIPFGAGNRVCIGNNFALMEARLILAILAQHFKFELEPSQKVEFDPQITLGLKYGLQVKLEEHSA